MWRQLGKVMSAEGRFQYKKEMVSRRERHERQARAMYDERNISAMRQDFSRPLVVSAALTATDEVGNEEKMNYESLFQFDIGHNPQFDKDKAEFQPLWDLTEPEVRLKAPRSVDAKYLQRYRVAPNVCGGCDGYQYQGRPLVSMTRDDCTQFDQYVWMDEYKQKRIGTTMARLLRLGGVRQKVV